MGKIQKVPVVFYKTAAGVVVVRDGSAVYRRPTATSLVET